MLKMPLGYAILLTLLLSCASFKESHSCDWSFKINGGNYQACRSDKTKQFALYDVDNDKILAKDSRKVSWFGHSGVVFVEYNGYIEKFYGKNLSKKETIKDTWGLGKVGGETKFGSSNNYNLIFYKDGVGIFDKKTGSISKKIKYTPKSASDHKTSSGDDIPAYIEYAFGDILGRSSVVINRRRVSRYQLYDKNAQPQLEREVLSRATSLYRNNGQYLLFKDIDPDLNIVRPIAAGIESDFFESRNIMGVILLDEMTWKLKKQSNQAPILPSFENFIIVVDNNGRRSYFLSSYLIDNNKSRSEQLDAFKQSLTPEGRGEVEEFSDLVLVTYVYKDKDGKFYEQKRPALKNLENKYVTADRYGNLNQYFDSKTDLQNKVSSLRAEYNSYIADIKERQQKEKAYRESRRKLDQEIADQQMREEQIRRENKERDARAMRAAKDSAWSGVADKIQNAGRASKSKTKCIRKRTQTKKDFLDKKQGWYQTGGC